MTLKFVIILQNLIKAYHTKSGKSKYDRKLTELDVETTRVQARVNGILELNRTFDVDMTCTWSLVRDCSCHRSKS